MRENHISFFFLVNPLTAKFARTPGRIAELHHINRPVHRTT